MVQGINNAVGFGAQVPGFFRLSRFYHAIVECQSSLEKESSGEQECLTLGLRDGCGGKLCSKPGRVQFLQGYAARGHAVFHPQFGVDALQVDPDRARGDI